MSIHVSFILHALHSEYEFMLSKYKKNQNLYTELFVFTLSYIQNPTEQWYKTTVLMHSNGFTLLHGLVFWSKIKLSTHIIDALLKAPKSSIQFPYVEYVSTAVPFSTCTSFQLHAHMHHISLTQQAYQYFKMEAFKYKLYFYDLYWKYIKILINGSQWTWNFSEKSNTWCSTTCLSTYLLPNIYL